MARTGIRAGLLAGAIGATVAVGAVPAAAVPPPCVVRDGAATFGTVQAAVDAASPGARLVVSGTCRGSTVVAKNLTLAGSTFGVNRPVLSGGGTVRVLRIEPEATVALTDLIIRDGNAAAGSGGGGIQNVGTLTATRVLVTRNRTTGAGGGILNLGDLVLIRSLLSLNRTPSDGGGIFNAGDLTMWSTDIKGNTSGGVGGGIFAEGIATLHTGVITGNTAADTGGGILTVNILTLDRTKIFGNTPNDCDC
jgi:hypothetical protein